MGGEYPEPGQKHEIPGIFEGVSYIGKHDKDNPGGKENQDDDIDGGDLDSKEFNQQKNAAGNCQDGKKHDEGFGKISGAEYVGKGIHNFVPGGVPGPYSQPEFLP
jgi:hypothetical protein